MKARLDGGKLIPPEDRARGVERLAALDAELARIDRQVGDPARTSRMAPEEAQRWRTSAACARKHLAREREQLAQWLALHPGDELLRRCEIVLTACDEDDALEDDERPLLVEVRAYLGALK